MKVCVVNPNYYRSSGVTSVIRSIYETVSQLGIDQYFVDCNHGSHDPNTDWIPADRLSSFRLMSTNPVHLVKEAFRFISWLRSHDIHVVHVHHRRLASLLWFLQGPGAFEVIYTSHLNYSFAPWFWLLSPKHVTAIGESVARNLNRTVRTNNVVTIYNPVQFPDAAPEEPRALTPASAVCIARLEPVKGHETLIRAWKALSSMGYRRTLYLVGEGSLDQSLRTLTKELDIEDLVVFTGFVQNVRLLIQDSLFAILVSSIEGLPIATIEAAACGRASLLTNVDGSKDCIPAGHQLPNGLDVGDVDGLSQALSTWFADPSKVMDEGQLFFNFHRNRSSRQVVGEQYAALYNSLLESSQYKSDLTNAA